MKNLFNKLNKKCKYYLHYKLEAYGGESIESYAQRLLDFYNEMSKNKLAIYASYVNNKRNVVIGEFNGINIFLQHLKTKDNIILEIKQNLYNNFNLIK